MNHLFTAYTFLLLIRILSSWLPGDWQRHRFVQFVAFYTEPYLGLFRRLIPPLGGMLDLSPILAFMALRLLQALINGLLQCP